VLPLWPNTKVPAHHGRDDCAGTGPCEHGHAGWEQRATADPQQLRVWWHARPDLNVGIATGPSGLHVLDLDRAGGESAPERWQDARHGRDVLAMLAAEAGQPYPGDTFSVRTPRGGCHLYFRAPQVPRLRNTVGLVGWRIICSRSSCCLVSGLCRCEVREARSERGGGRVRSRQVRLRVASSGVARRGEGLS
jgi:hypothetical protein